jgi:hypothetical protein
MVNVMFINVKKTYLVKTYMDKKLTFGHNEKTNLWNQINSIVLSGKKPLIMNNITFCKNLFYMSWSFRKRFGEEQKTQYKTQRYLLSFNCKFMIMMKPRMTNNFLFELPKQISMVLLHMFCHCRYAIALTISNEDFVAPCA